MEIPPIPLKILNNEVVDSIEDICKKRLTSPLYGVFLISWIVCHWNFIFTMFFVSEDKIWEATKMLKIDYMSKTFRNYSDWKFYLFGALPFLMTYLIIWHFPKWFSLPAYQKEEEYKTKKRKIKIKELNKLKELENTSKEKDIEKLTLEKKESQKKKEIEIIDPTINWKKEFLEFKNSIYYKDFDIILHSIYKKDGSISWYNSYKNYDSIPQSILAYGHSNNLIEFGPKQGFIQLTKKGKFFVKEFSLKNGKTEEMPF